MLFQTKIENFLQNGYFLCSPLLKKVWCIVGSEAKNQTYQRGKKTFFYKNDFYRTLKKPWISGTVYEIKISEFFNFFAKPNSIKSKIEQTVKVQLHHSTKPEIEWNEKDQLQYTKFFNLIKSGIKKNILKKAVPFSSETGKCTLTPNHLVYFFNQLSKLKKNKTVFMYGFWNFKKKYLQMGASPELIFLKKENQIHTIALAGTSINPKTEFKEQKMFTEHDFVIQDLYQKLSKFGKVHPGKSVQVKFGNYFHKKTKIITFCQNPQPSFSQILNSLYPSCAIGAYPRKKGLDFLRKIEKKLQIKRDFFASPFGLKTHDFMLCIGTIRGIEWSQNTLKVLAGGGVVEQSQLSLEWQEIILKLSSIKSIFGLI